MSWVISSLLEYLIKSVYRFMAKMENLSLVEEEIFRFLRKSFKLSPGEIETGIREAAGEAEEI